MKNVPTWCTAGRLVGVIFLICLHSLLLRGQSREQGLQVAIDPVSGAYAIRVPGSSLDLLKADVAVKFNGSWVESRNYPKQRVTITNVPDDLGIARQWTVTFFGLAGTPDISYRLRAYHDKPFGDIQVFVHNSTGNPIRVESIRAISALGNSILDLAGPAQEDRILSDSFSEGPQMYIRDLSDVKSRMLRAVGSQLVYNRRSHMSFFVGALTSDRFLTILRIHLTGNTIQPRIVAYEADSTGTTEMEKNYSLQKSSLADQVSLNITVPPGEELASERLMFSAETDYHSQLETYGSVVRQLHHARVSAPTPMGWWSWTAYYFNLNEGTALTNAQWLAQHLKKLGYNFFHIDEGYQYARGEYTTPNATLFPHGMAKLEQKIHDLGLVPGIWTAPFEVSDRSWVYQHHQDWLVHNANGSPIHIGTVSDSKEEQFVLDCTNPGAQAYLRKTYSTLVKVWGIRYIKLDFMDDTGIEGYYYRPNTTAMEAQRIGLGIIRNTVGNDVLLDKDGSMMLNPVGYVDFGRISIDSWHAFDSSKNAATLIAARYYMNRNFFVSDPDAFIVSATTVNGKLPLTLNEAEVSIALSEVSGGMHEIGDDLPSVGSEPKRLALIQNKDLIDMALLGRASVPVDLMTYLPEDEQPSIFFLKESPRQSILTIFNWTNHTRTHTISPASLGLNDGGTYKIYDVFGKDIIAAKGNSFVVRQPRHSVRMLKIIDTAMPSIPPTVRAQHPLSTEAGQTVKFMAYLVTPDIPVITYRWNFGDGVTQQGAAVSHAYTHRGIYEVKLTAIGLNGVAVEEKFRFSVTGTIPTKFNPQKIRRYQAVP